MPTLHRESYNRSVTQVRRRQRGTSPVTTVRRHPGGTLQVPARPAPEGSAAALVELANLTPDASTLKSFSADNLFLTGVRSGRVARGGPFRGARVAVLIVPSPGELRGFQGEVREAFERVVRGRPLGPVIEKINRSGPYRYMLRADPLSRAGHASDPHRKVGWELQIQTRPRALFLKALGDTLTISDRLGRCDHCRRFFLRGKRQYQRFCGERCSTVFHNKRRLETGYFRERRRKARLARSAAR